MSLLIGLEYAEELPPIVRAELEQLIATIQVGFSSQDGSVLQWVDVPYSSQLFKAKDAMTWTVDPGDYWTYRYVRTGKFVLLSFFIATTSVSGTPPCTKLYLMLPQGMVAASHMATPFHYLDNSTKGIGLATVHVGSNYIELTQTNYDASWTASGNATDVRGQIAIEVQ